MERKLTIRAFAVIDTNVIVASLLGNKKSSTKDIMELIRLGDIITLFDRRMTDEYYEVLSRFFTSDIVVEQIGTIVNNGYLVRNIRKTSEYFKDKSDIPFFEVKENAKELDPYLITGNAKDFDIENIDAKAKTISCLCILLLALLFKYKL